MNQSVLIIDDSKEILDNTRELLSLAGYTTYTANNGKEGLDLARKYHPDMILCDIMMPVLDGYGVLRALENLPELTGVPFIFLTAKAEKKDFRKGMDLGADDYLTKPFSGDELIRVVGARLKKNALLKSTFENNIEGLNEFINVARMQHDLQNLSEKRKVKKLRKKDILFIEGDSPNHLYYVISGKIKTFKTNDLGKEYITEIYKTGDFFGYVALFEDENLKESAMAIENSEIALIPRQDFFKLLYTNKDVSMKFIKFMSNSLSEAEQRLLQLAYDSARKRVAEALLFVAKKYEIDGKNELSFNPLRENISALAGISPESVSRNLTDFRDEGLIQTENGAIKIMDLKKLESMKN